MSDLNQKWAATIIGALVKSGVKHAVVAPGSRSTPLALACAARDDLRMWSIIDERSAAFFALGVAKSTTAPVAVICTSGTAGAHFLPAAIEAKTAGVPLVLLTADRPWELQDFGAPQTINQASLFGRWVCDEQLLPVPEAGDEAFAHLAAVVARSAWRAAHESRGPVHLNIPFREPLAPTTTEVVRLDPSIPAFAQQRVFADVSRCLDAVRHAERGLIVCGPREQNDGFGERVHAFAEQAGFAVFAEAASNARFGFSHAIGMYDALIRNEKLAARFTPDVVLRFGGGLTPKFPQQWLDRSGAKIFSFVEGDRFIDPSHRTTVFQCGSAIDALDALSAGMAAAPRTSPYRQQLLQVERRLREQLNSEQGVSESLVAREVVASLPADSSLFVSSSMPIRDVDAFAPSAAGRLRVFANRGVNGIDGIVSSALGVAAGSTGRTVLLTGDVALLHDLSGLVAAKRLGVELTVVVVNNDGGGIFSFLPIAKHGEHFEQLFGTPHAVDFQHAAALAGASISRPTTLAELKTALITARGLSIIEVRTDRTRNVTAHRDLFARLSQAAEAGAA